MASRSQRSFLLSFPSFSLFLHFVISLSFFSLPFSFNDSIKSIYVCYQLLTYFPLCFQFSYTTVESRTGKTQTIVWRGQSSTLSRVFQTYSLQPWMNVSWCYCYANFHSHFFESCSKVTIRWKVGEKVFHIAMSVKLLHKINISEH